MTAVETDAERRTCRQARLGRIVCGFVNPVRLLEGHGTHPRQSRRGRGRLE